MNRLSFSGKQKSLLIGRLFAVRTRLELVTPCVTGMYSNQTELTHRICLEFVEGGGAYGARTRDPMRDRHVF